MADKTLREEALTSKLMARVRGVSPPKDQTFATRAELRTSITENFGNDLDGLDYWIDRDAVFAFKNTLGTILFVKSEGGNYKCTLALGTVATRTGLQIKTLFNNAAEWLFTNTDATQIVAYIEAGNKPMFAMIPQTYGWHYEDQPWGKICILEKEAFLKEKAMAETSVVVKH